MKIFRKKKATVKILILKSALLINNPKNSTPSASVCSHWSTWSRFVSADWINHHHICKSWSPHVDCGWSRLKQSDTYIFSMSKGLSEPCLRVTPLPVSAAGLMTGATVFRLTLSLSRWCHCRRIASVLRRAAGVVWMPPLAPETLVLIQRRAQTHPAPACFKGNWLI